MEHSDLHGERPVKKTKEQKEQAFCAAMLAVGLVCIVLRLVLPGTDSEAWKIAILAASAFLAGFGAAGLVALRRPYERGWRVAEYVCVGLCLAAFGVSVWFSPDRGRDLWSFLLLLGLAVWNMLRRRLEDRENPDAGKS